MLLLKIKTLIETIFKDENKNLRLFILFAILILIISFQKCSNDRLKNDIKSKEGEIVRIKNNEKALKSNIETLKIDSTTLNSRLILELTEKELLESDFKMVSIENRKLKGDIKLLNQINSQLSIRDTIEVPVYIKVNDLGDSLITFVDSQRFDVNNWRIINGSIPFRIENGFINTGMGKFNIEQGISIRSAIIRDEKTKELTVLLETEYPGITFNNIQGSYIGDNSNKTEKDNRTISLGLNAGWGPVYTNNTFSTGFYTGFGVQYTPKFLRW